MAYTDTEKGGGTFISLYLQQCSKLKREELSIPAKEICGVKSGFYKLFSTNFYPYAPLSLSPTCPSHKEQNDFQVIHNKEDLLVFALKTGTHTFKVGDMAVNEPMKKV